MLPEDGEECLKRTHVATASVLKNLNYIATCVPELIKGIRWDDTTFDSTAVNQYWTTLGLEPEVCELLSLMHLRLIDGRLVCASSFRDLPDAVEQISTVIFAILRVRLYTDSRWCSQGPGLRPIIGGISCGLDAVMDLILKAHWTYKKTAKGWRGFDIDARVEMQLASDTGVGTAKSVGLGTIGFADAFDRLRPDLLIVLGDRFEALAAVQAAMALRIPIAHIHGGEATSSAGRQATGPRGPTRSEQAGQRTRPAAAHATAHPRRAAPAFPAPARNSAPMRWPRSSTPYPPGPHGRRRRQHAAPPTTHATRPPTQPRAT